MKDKEYFALIKGQISENDVVLYMKGTADFPQCGFSAMVVSILRTLGLRFKDINILEDDGMRQAIKDFSDWPTIPQLYILGKFVGGCDIVREMYESGELATLIEDLHRHEAGLPIEDSADTSSPKNH